MSRRSHGSGSVYQRESDGLWIGTLEAGWTTRGTRRRLTVSAKTKREALQKLRDKERAIARTGMPTETTSARATVKSWADEWLPIQETKLAPSSYNSTRSAITKWIIPTIGHVKLEAVAPPHARAVHTAMFNANLKPTSVIRAHNTLVKLLKDAITEGGHHVPEAIFKTSAPEANKSQRDALPFTDALKVLQASAQDPHASRWVAALLQALRPAEARGLTWSHVNFEEDYLDISWQLKPLNYKVARDRSSGFRTPRNFECQHLVDAYHLVRPKTDDGNRKIPLVPWMKAALLQWRDTQGHSPYDLVWSRDDGRPLTDKEDVKAWKALLASAELPEYDLYEARHTAATLLRAAGVDDETIIAIMGHASILSTKAYLHTDIDRARSALLKVAKTLQLEA
ncbi:tyrosine-type recombinase/integrase [Timonella senegalensis]|uniref:tyrosine-type recombinase/integrase n=1 Tax=Timonella senegalensis TaxID=1465825 RepID=UPI00031B5B78|nr:site-specific integrase [Timonella senegalensis]